jgi:hypothetical protein
MSDYIKRESIRNMYSCLDPNARVLVGQVLTDIDAIPTIDAVSVVRCDECKYCKEKGTSDCPSGYGYLYCTQKKSIVYEDDYCSWGEKR